MWYAAGSLAAFAGYWCIRHWFAFRPVRRLHARQAKLGNPVGRSWAEVVDTLGPPTRVPEPSADEKTAIWAESGRYTLLGVAAISCAAFVRLRFRDEICVGSAGGEWEEASENRGEAATADMADRVSTLVAEGWQVTAIREQFSYSSRRRRVARRELTVEFQQTIADA